MLEKITETDGRILLWIQENVRHDVLTPIVKAITYSGNWGAIMIAAVVILLIKPKTRKLGMMCGAALVVNLVICNLILKLAVARVRPYETIEGLELIVGKAYDWSFPSGHSSGGFAVGTVIFMETKKRVGVPVLILALLIALSRLYVGIHYPTDVLFGAIIGTVIGCVTCLILRRRLIHNS